MGLMTMLSNKYLLFVLRLILGGVFFYASFDKIAHPEALAKILWYYRILPGDLINLLALFLPWLELLTGLLLIIGYWEKAATLLVAGMLAIFIAALSMALSQGIDINCGCFSTTSKARSPIINLIIRDILMLVVCFLIVRAPASWLSVDGLLSRSKRATL
jgi:uncharacterized membrane protein YphA (DoxX/SURF4 family)